MRPTVLLLALALAASVHAAPPDVDPGTQVLAEVEGVVVTRAEFEAAAARKTPASGDTLSRDEKREVLDRLVDEKVLFTVALREGLDKDPKVQKVMINELLRSQVYSTVRNGDFTDEALQAYYDTHRSEFVVPEKVQIKRILIKVTDERPDKAARKEADRVRALVAAAPDSFPTVAAEVSEDPYRRRGGDVGFVGRDGKPGMDQAVVDRAFVLETGVVSEVFRTEEGYNIVMAAARREMVERTFQQMKGSVLRKVKNDRMKELYDAFVAKHRAAATVKVHDRALDAIVIHHAPSESFSPGGLEEGGVEEFPEP